MKAGFAIALLAIAMLCVCAVAQENTAESWYKTGKESLNKGEWKDAIGAYDKALQIDPTHVKAWSDKAVALDMLGKRDEAIQAFDKAIQQCDKVLQANPKDVTLRMWMPGSTKATLSSSGPIRCLELTASSKTGPSTSKRPLRPMTRLLRLIPEMQKL